MTHNEYTDLAIIGNGFDLAHGYKTSYGDFANAVGEEFFADYKEFLNTYLGNTNEWNCFEKQVENLTRAFFQNIVLENSDELNHIDELSRIDEFNRVFMCIKNELIKYLSKEIAIKPFDKIKAIKDIINENTVGLNFNYTDIAENYINDIIYVHGTLKENEIILGFDPPTPTCLAPYKSERWFKYYCRDRLCFKRYLVQNLHMTSRDTLYEQLCEDFESILSVENTGRGRIESDITELENGNVISEYLSIRNIDILTKMGVSLSNISNVIVLGHSIKSDETYLNEILSKCTNLNKIVIFQYEGEKTEDIELKKLFFNSYCSNIEFIKY